MSWSIKLFEAGSMSGSPDIPADLVWAVNGGMIALVWQGALFGVLATLAVRRSHS
jgi:hypothetical protein